MKKIGQAPYFDALLAHANPVAQPELPDDIPGEIWHAARLGTRRPSLGQWLFEFADHPEAIRLLGPTTRKKHRHWARIATGHLQYAMAGWSSPTGRLTIYLVDRESRRARTYAGSVDQFIRFIVEDPQEREHDEGLIDVIAAAVAPSTPPSVGWFMDSTLQWYAPVLEPLEETRRRIATKAHDRWLWHRANDFVVSVMRDGVRLLDGKGKAKTVKYPFAKGPHIHAALSATGDAVGIAAGANLCRLDRQSLTWSVVEVDWKSFYCGLASLEGEWFVAAERFGSKAVTVRLRAFRWTANGLEDEVFLNSDDLPEYPNVFGDAELPIALVSCYPTPTALIVAVVDGKPTVAGTAPHEVTELRRCEEGWRAGAAKAHSLIPHGLAAP